MLSPFVHPFRPETRFRGYKTFFMLNLVEHEIFRSDFTSKLEHGLAFGTPKFYIVPYDKINHTLVNLSYNCDVESQK